MRKLVLILAGLLLLPVFMSGQACITGDVNASETIDIVDALLIAQAYVGLNPPNYNEGCADTNCSGSVDIVDALLVAQYYVGLISSISCSTPDSTPVPTPGGSVSIACGSSSAVGSFLADQYYTGGTAYNNTNTVDVSLITDNPPPATLFNNERYGAMTYTIPGFTAGGTYAVYLYFAETYLTATGGRLFNVSINGTAVLTNFDIFAAAGAQNKAVAQAFTTTADGSGQIVVGFTSVTENPKINGISIQAGTAPTTGPTAIPTATPTAGPTGGGSTGCGKDLTDLTSGTYTITSAGLSRQYIINIPANYDKNKPYRLIFAMHCMGSSATGVVGEKYYSLQPLASSANVPVIFVAPQGYTDSMPWRTGDNKDHIFFDDMLKLFKEKLCVDTSRVFSCGFSFGAMFTYSLSLNHQNDLRAVAVYAPANYNIYLPTKIVQPIAYFQTTGTSDGTCPWVNSDSAKRGGKYCVIQHLEDNGCTVPSNIPLATGGTHVSTDFSCNAADRKSVV